jgi:endoribonuclease Dicer
LHGGIQIDGIAVLVHDTIVVGPVVATSLSVATFLASERALMILSDVTLEKFLSRLCICGRIIEVDVAEGVRQADTSVAAREAALDDLSE